MMQDDGPADIAASQALRRTRRLATGMLLVLAAIFAASYLVGEPPGWLLLIRSMAEAGMVGGLADWFAVTALFRHPLGIPIPHTALLPRNQARAARNVGRFFETHFLQPEQLRERLLPLNPSRFLLDWIDKPGHADMIAAELAAVLSALLHADPPKRALVHLRRWLRNAATEFGSDAVIAERMAELLKVGLHSGILDQALARLARNIDERREGAVDLVRDHSRWWVSGRVDRQVANLVVRGILMVLEEQQEPDSRLRKSLQATIDRLVDELAASGALTRAVAEARQHMIRSGTLDEAFTGLGKQAQRRLIQRLEENPEPLQDLLAQTIRGAVTNMLSRPAARDSFDARLADLASRILGELRPQIAGYVSDVIADWEPEELNARFEAELGPDLQYIRINGAVIGALIGGLLFGLESLLG